MRANFPAINKLVLKTEGGYVNDPQDPGGPTYKGVTLRNAQKYIDPKLTAATLRKLTDEQIGIFYERNYWRTIDADNRAGGLDYTLYDYGVNSGVGRPNNVLRALLNLPKKATWGEVVVALREYDTAVVINGVNDERMRFLKGLRTFARFGKGWTSRVASVRTVSGVMDRADKSDEIPYNSKEAAEAGIVSAMTETEGGNAKAVPTVDPKNRAVAVTGVAGGTAAVPATVGLSGYELMFLAFGAVALIALVLWLIERANERKATEPALGTVPLPKLAGAGS